MSAATAEFVLAGGRVIDPATGTDRVTDVVVGDGTITRVGPAGDAPGERIDVSGRLVVPGLIDGHAHCYGGIGAFHPDAIGVSVGVTTIVDAASAGVATIEDAFVAVEGALTDVYFILFVHPQGIGSPITNHQIQATKGGRMVEAIEDLPVGEIIRTIGRHRDRIRALKSSAFPDRGPEWVRMVQPIARWAGVPAYFHIGNFGHDTEAPPSMAPHFAALEAGDIVTHIYTDATGGVLDERGVVEPEVLRAAERGVHFDLGFGPTGFSFEVAERARAQGVDVTSLSTDWQQASPRKPGYDLVGLMGVMSCLGFGITDLVPMVTSTPARMFHLDEFGLGTLAEGTVADVSVLTVEEGDFEYTDTSREARRGPLRFTPHLTVKRGQVVEPDPQRPHAPESRKYVISDDVERLARAVPGGARAALRSLAGLVDAVDGWDPESLHRAAHGVFRTHGLDLRVGLEAVYRSFMERSDGPQLGWWLVSLIEEQGIDVSGRLRAAADPT